MSDPSGRAYPLMGRPIKREHCPSSQGAQRLRTSCAAPGNPSEDAAGPTRRPPLAAVTLKKISDKCCTQFFGQITVEWSKN
jgi:hypothetical protein